MKDFSELVGSFFPAILDIANINHDEIYTIESITSPGFLIAAVMPSSGIMQDRLMRLNLDILSSSRGGLGDEVGVLYITDTEWTIAAAFCPFYSMKLSGLPMIYEERIECEKQSENIPPSRWHINPIGGIQHLEEKFSKSYHPPISTHLHLGDRWIKGIETSISTQYCLVYREAE